MLNIEEKATLMKSWVVELGKQLEMGMKTAYQIESKSNPKDLVTEWDRWIERELFNRINGEWPDDWVLGEEGESSCNSSYSPTSNGWIIDPIDGTMNFVRRKKDFAMSIAYVEGGIPKIGIIYDVMNQTMYWGITGSGAWCNSDKLEKVKQLPFEECIVAFNPRWLIAKENTEINAETLGNWALQASGIRSNSSAALEIANVASGASSFYYNPSLKPWDYAAGIVLLHEVDAIACNATGKTLSLHEAQGFLGGMKHIVDDFLEQVLRCK